MNDEDVLILKRADSLEDVGSHITGHYDQPPEEVRPELAETPGAVAAHRESQEDDPIAADVGVQREKVLDALEYVVTRLADIGVGQPARLGRNQRIAQHAGGLGEPLHLGLFVDAAAVQGDDKRILLAGIKVLRQKDRVWLQGVVDLGSVGISLDRVRTKDGR